MPGRVVYPLDTVERHYGAVFRFVRGPLVVQVGSKAPPGGEALTQVEFDYLNLSF